MSKTTEDFVQEMLDNGTKSTLTRAQWNVDKRFCLYFRAGRASQDGQYCLKAVVSNVTSRLPGKGNYSKLLEFIEQEASSRGYNYLSIENPQPEHVSAYLRRGFHEKKYEQITTECVKVLNTCPESARK